MAKVTNQLAKVDLKFVKEWQSNKFGPERILLKTKIQKSKYDPLGSQEIQEIYTKKEKHVPLLLLLFK
jgi:hypothetical protein